MHFILSIFLSLPLIAHSEPISDLDNLCEEPKFVMKSMPSNGGGSLEELKLLNETEKNDPELAKKVVASPGGYGHSELGIRYLGRFFGYPAEYDNNTKKKVEDWLADQEYNKNQMYRGSQELWDKWVANTSLRLEVPQGPFRTLPTNGDPKVFFRDSRTQAVFATCIRTDIAKKLCENYMGDGRTIEEGDQVYFGKQNGRGFCKVPLAKWKKAREERDFKNAQDSLPENKSAQ